LNLIISLIIFNSLSAQKKSLRTIRDRNKEQLGSFVSLSLKEIGIIRIIAFRNENKYFFSFLGLISGHYSHFFQKKRNELF